MRMAKVFFTFSYNQTQQKELHVGVLTFALKKRKKKKSILIYSFKYFIVLFSVYFGKNKIKPQMGYVFIYLESKKKKSGSPLKWENQAQFLFIFRF